MSRKVIDLAKPEALAAWTNEFAAEFFKVCILIECVSGREYESFYEPVLDYYRTFVEDESFDRNEIMLSVCEVFRRELALFEREYSMIEPDGNGTRALKSADDCVRVFTGFFARQKEVK